jgi:hypothetical protein
MSSVPLPDVADPLAEARIQLSVVTADAPKAVAIVGAGLGYLTEAARERWPEAVLVVLEPRPELAHAAVTRTPALYASGRVHVLAGPDYQGADALWKVFDAADAVSPASGVTPAIVVNPVLAQTAPAPVAKALRVARRAIDAATMNARAREDNAWRYVLNTLRNVEHIVDGPDPGALRGRFAGVPAIVVAAGPSLDHSLEALRAVAGRALVVAADTAWRPLVAAGIEPDLVVATDPTEANGRHLKGVGGSGKTWVLAEGSVDPDALSALRGRVSVFRIAPHHPWPWLQSLGIERDVVKAWGSVLTSAYDIAITAGCHPVVFIGADLAFTDRRPYCRGTSMEDNWARHAARGASLRRVWEDTISARPLLTEPDVRGGETVTAPHLLEFRNWLTAQARTEPVGRVVNATGAGILQGSGITQGDLASALDGFPEIEVALRETIAAAFDSRADAPTRARLAEALRAIDPNRGDWLRFGRPRLTAVDIAAAAAAGVESLDAANPGERAAHMDAHRVRKPRWHAADRVARMRALLSGEESGLDGTSPRPSAGAASREEAIADAARATDALLALPQLATGPGEDVARGADPRDVPFSARFEWVEAARPLVAVLEESLIELGVCARGEPLPTNPGDFWRGPIAPVDAGDTKPARALAEIGGGRAAVLAERLAIEAAAPAEGLTARRRTRLLQAIARGVADRRLTDAQSIRLQPPASAHAIALPLRVDAVMRAITGSIARPVLDRDSRVLLASESVSYCEPRMLTHPLRSPGWTVITLDDGHAVFTPKDNRRSLVVDTNGNHVRGAAWPLPILAEAPWGDQGGAIAWAHPSTMLFRRAADAPVVVEPVPFTARQFSIGPDGSAYWLETNGALWEWLPGGTRRFVLFAPGLGYIRHEGRDVVLAPVARDVKGAVLRRRFDYEWQYDGAPHAYHEIETAPEGQCSKVAPGPWTARAYPFSDLVRLTDGGGLAWLLACHAAFGVAWAGSSLLVTTQEGRLLMFPRLAEQLDALSGPALAQPAGARDERRRTLAKCVM